MTPKISEFETFREFAEHFTLDEGDTILTEKFLYDRYMDGVVDCDVLFLDDFGLGEPSDTVIDAILDAIRGRKIKRIVGIGGGTILDIAKLLCVKDATTTEDIFDDVVAPIRDKGLILVPTTCGTGCEMTCVSVVDMTRRGTKMGKRIEANFADHAVLIPELLGNLPEKVFQFSSIDALIHAMEIFVAPTGNPYNDVFCSTAIRTILTRYRVLAEEGPEKRHDYVIDFLRASTFAGIALANTACGAVHALAMHFGSVHHVAHGESNSVFLVAVFRKYLEINPTGKLMELAAIINEAAGAGDAGADAFENLGKLIQRLMPRKSLAQYGVPEDQLGAYADKVMETQQRLLKNNFTRLAKEDLVAIYRAVY
jgi:4-hydroxybutyrate dehydrogenase